MGERTSNEMCNLSLQQRFSRDLLQRFRVNPNPNPKGSGDPTGSDPEELELNLGLSLGGRFGVDKSNSKLGRSSSIAAILPVVKKDDADDDVVLGVGEGKTGRVGSYTGLIRTSSLPVETEEEWRKRKELQSLRRLAAKRRRSEKQRSLTKVEREEYVAAMGRVGSSVGPSLGSGSWDFGDVNGLIGKGGRVSGGGATSDGSGGGGLAQPSTLPPRSVESQSSSVSEFESRHFQGSSTEGETSLQSGQEGIKQDDNRSKAMNLGVRALRPKTENPSNHKGKETRSNMVDMPCVFTQGDSPSGRRIEGILYKYGKGEEVKIMCVCHGSFLSPAEFVKHAGGTDVLHPLKHIVVNPNSSSYL
ncbi:hypothetical protein OSB04_009011 [Centaurea solstitialis]|uniref:Ninja-family protein n=1 Tax=Centaurea solstitialis TaxID=347529 RepID=A0AA38U0K8_9ASTR|nr:hypothetical protein OSB04_009011 [Centaurea solstitialis]